MGVLDRLGLVPASGLVNGPSRPTKISTPWSESNLTETVLADVFGGEYQSVTRLQAMRIPAVAKARALIVGPLAAQPLRVLEGDTEIAEQPAWLQRTAGPVSPWHRMAWTLDDLLFYGWSLWAVTRTPANDAILDAQRVPYDRWRFNEADEVELHTSRGWVPAPRDQVILIPSGQEGLLDIASNTIRGAAAIEETWVERARTPIPMLEIRQTQDDELEEDEVEALVAAVASARRNRTNPVAFTPGGVEIVTHGSIETNLYVEGRNAFTLDVARFTALPGALLDASMATASLTYSTAEGKRNELVDYSLAFWANPIAGRFSQDDVVPMGQRVRFDLTDFIAPNASPTGPVTED